MDKIEWLVEVSSFYLGKPVEFRLFRPESDPSGWRAQISASDGDLYEATEPTASAALEKLCGAFASFLGERVAFSNKLLARRDQARRA